ncbi:5-hydroxytryptamine receptor 3A-like isoform X2 [Rhinatrema bivittatum]|uniref:5-hydroxytryptamine receptor 3A-like isoform X2 n=1 Tax=Rhinatrema bivittatum TaxID=194408 RepID=UPI0011289E89|nr:5-hydroxytryptamine receptor 3A-like isoform X2 [Rhinatrema bivittatum]
MLTVEWTNEFVSWNPRDFCNITHITLPVKLFWVPDIVIHQQTSEDKAPKLPYAVVAYDGTISMSNPLQIISTCNLDVSKFPFDTQHCQLSVGPYMHSDKLIKMKAAQTSAEASRVSHEFYLSNGEWNFMNMTIVQEVIKYNEGYSLITYKLSMERRPVLHVLNLILPTSSFLLMDTATCFISGCHTEKTAFKITLILGVSVLSLILNEILPTTSNNPPVIAIFFTGSFVFMIAGILEIFIEQYLESRSRHPLPKVLKQILRCLKQDKKNAETSLQAMCIPDEPLREELETKNLSVMNKENGEIIGLLKRIHSEVLLIGKQISSNKSQDPTYTEWASLIAVIKMGLFYIHLIAVIFFSVFIALQWAS